MFHNSRGIHILLIIVMMVLTIVSGNIFAETMRGGEKLAAVYGNETRGGSSHEGIYLMQSKEIPTTSDMEVSVSVICVEGFKYLQVITHQDERFSTDLVQMNEPIQSQSLPIRCTPSR